MKSVVKPREEGYKGQAKETPQVSFRAGRDTRQPQRMEISMEGQWGQWAMWYLERQGGARGGGVSRNQPLCKGYAPGTAWGLTAVANDWKQRELMAFVLPLEEGGAQTRAGTMRTGGGVEK